MHFFYEILKMPKKEGKINYSIIENMLSWRNLGFRVGDLGGDLVGI